MRKFIKYEIKGSYKFILGVLLLTTILNLGSFTYLNNVDTPNVSTIGSIFLGIAFLIIFGMMVATAFYIVNLFKKELYEDRGYLTFTIPLSAKKILGSKVFVAFLWFVVIFIGFILSNALGVLIITPRGELNSILEALKSLNISWAEVPWVEGFATLIALIINGITLLLTIYFSMTLGRVSIRNKKFKGIWFFIFIFVSILLLMVMVKGIEIVPYYLNVSRLGIESISTYHALATVNINGDLLINIGSIIYSILAPVLLFFLTSSLMENSIDV